MPKIEFTVESTLPPERIIAAAADFTDRRPDIWPNISRRYYKVHDQGEDWCECTEGSDIAGGIWARERYEWTANAIKGTVLDSNIFKGGTWELRAEPKQGGGSLVTVVNNRRPKGKGLAFAPMMMLNGKRMLEGHLRKTLELIEAQPNA